MSRREGKSRTIRRDRKRILCLYKLRGGTSVCAHRRSVHGPFENPARQKPVWILSSRAAIAVISTENRGYVRVPDLQRSKPEIAIERRFAY